MKFEVSVIIPVYNAEKFIEEAVNSAVHLNEVAEIILVEDHSPDNALLICQELEIKYQKVRLLQHPGAVNKGAGASRNLGILEAKYEYISFLDADDVYLPNRFEVEKNLYREGKLGDGVFHNSGKYSSKELYYDQENIKNIRNLPGKDYLYGLFRGSFSLATNSITIKRTLFNKTKYFNEELKLHQDTHMWYKVFHFGKIKAGSLELPVSLTREHEERRIYNRSQDSKLEFLEAVFSDFKDYSGVDPKFMRSILHRYVNAKSHSTFGKIKQWVGVILKFPKLIKYYL